MQHYSISLITVCKNRLHHLQETLPKNVLDNAAYPDVEFIVLDYNSNDGLSAWMKEHMMGYIKCGRVKFYQTFEPDSYHPAHSRNMAFLLAGGDLLCNQDADNYTGEGFASYMNGRFRENERRILVTFGGRRKIASTDTYGRLCFTRDDFANVKGYDEKMGFYGGEDIDMARRVMALGREAVVTEDAHFLRSIKHTDAERLKEMDILQQLQYCFLAESNHQVRYILLLYRNGQFELITMEHSGKMALRSVAAPDTGTFQWQGSLLCLSFDQGFIWRFSGAAGGKVLHLDKASSSLVLYRVEGQQGLAAWSMQYMLLKTRTQSGKDKTVNPEGFGTGTVYRNFNYEEAIHVSGS